MDIKQLPDQPTTAAESYALLNFGGRYLANGVLETEEQYNDRVALLRQFMANLVASGMTMDDLL